MELAKASPTPKQVINQRYGTGTWANMVAILEACRALEADGQPIEKVNRTDLAAASGVTANNEVAAGKQLYKERRDLLNSLPHTPTAIAEVMLRAVEAEFVHLKTQFEERIAAEQEVFTAALDASSETYRALQEEKGELLDTVGAKDEEITFLKARVHELEQQVNQLTNEKTEALIAAESAETSRERCQALLRKRRYQIRRSEEQFREERTRQAQVWAEQKSDLKAESERALDRLMRELDTVRTERKSMEAELQERISRTQDELAERQRTVHQQTDQAVRLTLENEGLRAQATDSAEQLRRAEKERAAAQSERDALAQQSESLRMEVELLRGQSQQLESLTAVLTALEARLREPSSQPPERRQ